MQSWPQLTPSLLSWRRQRTLQLASQALGRLRGVGGYNTFSHCGLFVIGWDNVHEVHVSPANGNPVMMS
jgi:hypothetical protein